MNMATMSTTRSMIEGLVGDNSFKWLLGKQSSFSEEFEQLEASPSAGKNWISELSPFANLVVRRCLKILAIATADLKESFNAEASDALKHPSCYARNFLEYCCFRALAVSIKITGHLMDKKFRRLTYDMMLAWETPDATSPPQIIVDEELSVGLEAFSRIAPAVPIISDVVICDNLFEVLSKSTGGRLHFSVYDKYLSGLERAIRKMKNHTDSSLLSAVRASRRERILEVDGTVATQPVFEHVGTSAWPGRLTLTDHALYFEAHRVVSYDKPKVYDLSEDLKQLVKPDMTGPWGTRLFDKAVSYKSISLSEPIIFEFPELNGHSRRDFWLAIIREVLYAHKFIARFQISGVEKDEALSRTALGILRLQAVQDVIPTDCIRFESLLMFNLCDQLPGGDFILETLANISSNSKAGGGMYSVSALTMASSLGFVFGTNSTEPHESRLSVGEIAVGEKSALEKAVQESRSSYKMVVQAQETVDGAKVDGIDTNLAVMKELLYPVTEVGNLVMSLLYWDDRLKSTVFCLVFAFLIWRGRLCYAFGMLLLFFAIFIMLTRLSNGGRPIVPLSVIAPPPSNTMEQLLAVQNAISQVEQIVQDGNVFLLKLRALFLAIFPQIIARRLLGTAMSIFPLSKLIGRSCDGQASEKVAMVLAAQALVLAFVPLKYIVLFVFVETFTMYSPPRKASSERCKRRIKEWWFSIPAAPVVLERDAKEEKKKK